LKLDNRDLLGILTYRMAVQMLSTIIYHFNKMI
jgi:hypothetical protein